ncbi:MAG: DMT family transporter [Candidatus Promineifilaceae bacterium]
MTAPPESNTEQYQNPSQPAETASPQKGIFGRHFTIQWQRGLIWALISPIFLGTMPIFAKLAYAANVDVFTVAALRTTVAAFLMWLAALTIGRKFIRSSTPAILGSMVAGGINGLGSIFFYGSLVLIDASLGQLINITYLIFVTILLRLAGQVVSWLTIGRTLLAIGGIFLLTVGGLGPPNWLGVGLMLVAALAYAVQLVIGQRVMYDIPAATMTLYAITAMALVVNVAWLFVTPDLGAATWAGWRAVILMGIFTALSRLTLFMGVKHLGSMQAALLGVLEVIVTLIIAIILLHEHLEPLQWLGALVVLVSVYLIRFERGVPRFVDIWPLLYRVWAKIGPNKYPVGSKRLTVSRLVIVCKINGATGVVVGFQVIESLFSIFNNSIN